LAANNSKPKPLIWTASADSILEKVARGRVALNQATKTGTHH
ncbi:MAG: Transposase, partial [Aeromicrobium sp.]|nr:Transposase [Aeromicrobium sp.]